MDYELVIHAGANKTGSSAIQSFIRENSSQLLKDGYAIPDRTLKWSPLVTGEHVFALQAIFGPDSNHIMSVFKTLMAERPSGSTVLISAENLSNPGNAAFLKEICRAYRTKVILYIRRQDEFITSSWQQWHSKKEVDLNAWLITAVRQLGHWENIAAAWEACVGQDGLNLRIFEKQSFPEGNILADFLAALGLADRQAAYQMSSKNVNPSFSDFITPLVAGNRHIFSDANDNRFFHIVEKLTGTAYSSGRKVSLISREQRDNIVAYYELENRRLCQRWFPGRERLFEKVSHANYLYPKPEDLMDMQLKFITHMLFEVARRIEG